MKRYATLIVLAVLTVALTIWVWRDRGSVTEGEKRLRENAVFSAWRREELTRIEISHDDETIVLVKGTGGSDAWRMTFPRDARVDQQAVERLLTTLEFSNVVRKVDKEASLGFAAPRAHGSIAMGKLVFRFMLGGPSPRPEGSSYFRVDEHDPFVVSAETTRALLASSDTYRDRTVVPYLSTEVERVEVAHSGGGFVLARLDKSGFRVHDRTGAPPYANAVSAPGVLASRVELDKIWGAFAEMRAEVFPKDSDVDRLTASPVLTITMKPTDGGKPEGELVVGEACPGHPADVVVLQKRPSRTAACAPRGAIDALRAALASSLVERRVFSLRNDEIEEIRFERLGGEASPPESHGADGGPVDGGTADSGPPAKASAERAIELARSGHGFKERAPEDKLLDGEEADAVAELLVRIERSIADAVVPSASAAGAFTPIAKVRVRAGEHEETVEMGATPFRVTGSAGAPDEIPLRRARDDARLTVSSAIARRLLPRATTLRPRTILGERRRVTRVSLRCGTPQELVDSGRGFALTSPTGYEADGSITQLVDALVRGRADVWISDYDRAEFGIEPTGCRVALGFEDDKSPVTVLFGAEGEGGVYGRVEGQEQVFLAPLSILALAKAIYVSHAALRADPAAIDDVRVTVAGKPVRGDREALRDAAGILYASSVASLGTPDPSIGGDRDLALELLLADGGAPKRVVCGGARPDETRLCVTPTVRATFVVPEGRIAPFLGLPSKDAGADAATRDGGSDGGDGGRSGPGAGGRDR